MHVHWSNFRAQKLTRCAMPNGEADGPGSDGEPPDHGGYHGHHGWGWDHGKGGTDGKLASGLHFFYFPKLVR